METKIWDTSFTKEDIERLFNRPISSDMWNIIVDKLYNDDYLFYTITNLVVETVRQTIND